MGLVKSIGLYMIGRRLVFARRHVLTRRCGKGRRLGSTYREMWDGRVTGQYLKGDVFREFRRGGAVPIRRYSGKEERQYLSGDVLREGGGTVPFRR